MGQPQRTRQGVDQGKMGEQLRAIKKKENIRRAMGALDRRSGPQHESEMPAVRDAQKQHLEPDIHRGAQRDRKTEDRNDTAKGGTRKNKVLTKRERMGLEAGRKEEKFAEHAPLRGLG